MIVVESDILVHVPRADCFNLARTVEVHLAAESRRQERAVDGRTTGRLHLGDTITFEAIHFGVRQRLTSKIVQMHAFDVFIDEMQRGAFQRLRHTHRFHDAPSGTLMRDRLEFSAPLGALGRIAERLFLRRYMQNFLHQHQNAFRTIAEGSIHG